VPPVATQAPDSWLLLVHQLPPRPLYLRAQVRRRLAQVGALAVKNSVYVLPDLPDCLEDLQWIAQEAVSAGGEACVFRTALVSGLSAEALRQRFRAASAERYAPIKSALDRLLGGTPGRGRRPAAAPAAVVQRLRRQIDAARACDFFHADIGQEVQEMVRTLERAQSKAPGRGSARGRVPAAPAGSVWVTRRGPKIDRLATAWLIRRFVDPTARFRFVDPPGDSARPGERTFDMVGADFGHEADRCTFETMRLKFGLDEPALEPIGQIVHDLDLKDGKFGRPEAAGLQTIVSGLIEAHPNGAARIAAALPVFDALLLSFGGRAGQPPKTGRRATRGRRTSRSS